MEQDPLEILEMVNRCMDEAIAKLRSATSNAYDRGDIAAVGITNQRETVVVWDKNTGRPLYNAIGKFNTKKNICKNRIRKVIFGIQLFKIVSSKRGLDLKMLKRQFF